jgi:ADP-heptose:LPS heptosyltransferase
VPLRAVCAVLERCNLFVGNDSGTAHLAAAMECPTVVVSRHPANGDPNHANSPARFGPRCALSRVVQPVSGDGECVSSFLSAEAHSILSVTVERVVAAAAELLVEIDSASKRKVTANGISDLAAVALAERAYAARVVAVS